MKSVHRIVYVHTSTIYPMPEEDDAKQASWIALLNLVKEILETCIQVLGFEAPDRM